MRPHAEADGICISGKVHDDVESKLDFGFDYLGEEPVKNILKPVRVYRVRTEVHAPEARAARRRAPLLIAVAEAAIVIAAGAALWAL